MAKDLRTYPEQMEREKPQAVLRIKKPLKVAYEITALQRKLDALKKFPVIIVDRPILDDGQESPFPAVTNLTASRDLCAEVLGIDPRRVAMEYAAKVDRIKLHCPFCHLEFDKEESPRTWGN